MKYIILTGFFVLAAFLTHAQGTLQFNRVLLVGPTPQTVPAGKVWKIENVYYETGTFKQASSGSGTCTNPCNGSTQIWTSYNTVSCAFSNTTPITINGVACSLGSPGSPLWLPAGVVLSGSSKTCIDSGYYGSCSSCPSPTVINAYASVIEFNIIP
jgi:hypothetical protein